jgi:hypothetical protein
MAGSTPGRKPKLTKDSEKRIIGLLEAGVPKDLACFAIGINSRTLRVWHERARNGEARYVAFWDNVETAIAKAQSSMLVQIRKAGAKDWKALAWFMERVWSERYGYKSQVKVSVEAELEKMLDVATTVLGTEAAAKLFAALAGNACGEAGETAGGATPEGTTVN